MPDRVSATTYTENDEDGIAAVLIGRRIVAAEMGRFDYPGRGKYSELAEGRLVLDNGTVLYLTGNEGGCSCSAGCYPLQRVATADNVITRVRVECAPHGDDFDDDTDRDWGAYRIFVFSGATEINVADFAGSDGNGYYGTGFELCVVVPGPDTEDTDA